jgi:2-polyprenyl-3-methyl-5-hydroxy-6-metoxy-1,4-benzoquinol methylase
MALEKVGTCPICGASEFASFLVCKDHTTSGESFEIQNCKACGFAFTNPRPNSLTIGKYYASDSYISHNTKSNGLLDLAYFLARRFTLQWKKKLLSKYNGTGSLLDYGCGTGEFLNACKKDDRDCSGVEPSEQARKIALQKTGITILTKFEDLGDKKFDVITLWHVLEHVHDLNNIMAQLKDSLKKTGTLLIAVPNYESFDAKVYQQCWAGYDVPRHLWHFSKKTMTLLLKKHGLHIKEILPMKLDSLYVSILSEGYQSARRRRMSGVLRGIYNGINSNIKARNTNNHSSLIYVCTLEA